jgi:hypothetical protein
MPFLHKYAQRATIALIVRSQNVKSLGRLALVATVATLVSSNGGAGSLRKKWTRNLSGAVEVYAVAFSPDGRRIAASIGPPSQSAVLVMDTTSPQSDPTLFDISPKGQYRSGPLPLSWSASGTHLLVGSRVIDIFGGEACQLPPQDFVEPEFVSGALVGRQVKPMRLRSLDLGCRFTADIDLGDGLWNLLDVSPERGLLLIWRQHYHGPASVDWDLSLVTAKTGNLVQRLPLLSEARFLDSGRIVCGVQGTQWHRTVQCLEANTAHLLVTTRQWTAPQVQAARNAKRAIISDYRRKFDWTDWVWRTGELKNRTVWDFGTGAPIISWRPKVQTTTLGSLPLEVAISPDGDFLVEGGAGVVTLYQIEP